MECSTGDCNNPRAKRRTICHKCHARKNRLGSVDAPVREIKHRIAEVSDNRGLCSTCGEVDVYWRDSGKWSGWACLPSKRLRVNANKYGITAQEYAGWFNRAGHKCQLCGSIEGLALDHCHSTGKIRGVLCMACNTSIGKLGDTAEVLYRAWLYLKGSEDAPELG